MTSSNELDHLCDQVDVTLAVRRFYEALNAYDAEKLRSLVAARSLWFQAITYYRTVEAQLSVDHIGTPRVEGGGYTVDVITTISTTGRWKLKEGSPTTVMTLRLFQKDGAWKVGEPVQ